MGLHKTLANFNGIMAQLVNLYHIIRLSRKLVRQYVNRSASVSFSTQPGITVRTATTLVCLRGTLLYLLPFLGTNNLKTVLLRMRGTGADLGIL